MSVTDDLIGIIPPIIVAGAVTKMASSAFGNEKKEKQRTRVIYKKVYVQRKKAHAKRVKAIKKSVKKYL
jgi:hypothetical protein